MIVIGLTGSIATGKSETAKMFLAEGVPVLDSDAVVHALYGRGGKAVPPMMTIAPEAKTGGAVDRGKLAVLLREKPGLLARVEEIVHPLVWQAQREFVAAEKARGARLAVLDIPLLFEKNREADVDVIVVTTCPPAMQRERALARPGMTEEKLNWILARQTPDAEKRRRAHYVIDTSRGLEPAREQVRAIIGELDARNRS
jgi:dephospho-CoA kinase